MGEGQRRAGRRLDCIAAQSIARVSRGDRLSAYKRSPTDSTVDAARTLPRAVDSSSALSRPCAAREEYSDPSMSEILPRLDVLDHAVERLTSVISRRPIGREGIPRLAGRVAGDPHSYDGPDSGRKVCVRILPSTSPHAQLQATGSVAWGSTVAAAWEFLCAWDSQQSVCLFDGIEPTRGRSARGGNAPVQQLCKRLAKRMSWHAAQPVSNRVLAEHW